MKKNQLPIKRMNIEIPLGMHCDIKKYAASRNMSMALYVFELLDEQIKKEREYEQTK